MTVREDARYRTGIERWDGQPMARPTYPPRRLHFHYCPDHDHPWTCAVDPCLRYEAARCQEEPR